MCHSSVLGRRTRVSRVARIYRRRRYTVSHAVATEQGGGAATGAPGVRGPADGGHGVGTQRGTYCRRAQRARPREHLCASRTPCATALRRPLLCFVDPPPPLLPPVCVHVDITGHGRLDCKRFPTYGVLQTLPCRETSTVHSAATLWFDVGDDYESFTAISKIINLTAVTALSLGSVLRLREAR